MTRTIKLASKPVIATLSERDLVAAGLAATMPTDRPGLLAVAKECVELYNAAVLDRADFAALVIGERYEAAVWKLNGGTHFGSGVGEGVGRRDRQASLPGGTWCVSDVGPTG